MATQTTETTISSRTRNLGYGWTTQPVQTPSGLEIEPVEGPDVIGGLRTVEDERRSAGRVVSGGTYYRERLFIGKRPILAVWGSYFDGPDTSDEHWGNSDNWKTGWVSYRVGEVLTQLRDGESIRVKLGA